MPRANRYFLPGYVWHLTHRCHDQAFLLKFVKDRDCWLSWLREAKKRYGLCVLNYMITSNHVHLLVKDHGKGEVARTMQLIEGRVAQAYNNRKGRKGAFWEDRYHATAVDTDDHLARCLAYIDLNMVRAGAVSHPMEWVHCGYRETQCPPQRQGLIDHAALMGLLGMDGFVELQQARREWVEDRLSTGALQRDPAWTDALAVGRPGFLREVRDRLGVSARYREVWLEGATHVLREAAAEYAVTENPALSAGRKP